MRTVLVVCLLVVVLSAAGSGAPGLDVSQEPDTIRVTPGEHVQIAVTVNATGYDAPALDLSVPAGWSVTNVSTDRARYRATAHQWLWLSGGHKQATYTLYVPPDAAPGTTIVRVNASAIIPHNGRFVSTTDDVTITVAEPTTNATTRSPTQPSATTTPPPASATTTPTSTGTTVSTRQLATTTTTNAGESPTTVTTDSDSDSDSDQSTATQDTRTDGTTEAPATGFGVLVGLLAVLAASFQYE